MRQVPGSISELTEAEARAFLKWLFTKYKWDRADLRRWFELTKEGIES